MLDKSTDHFFKSINIHNLSILDSFKFSALRLKLKTYPRRIVTIDKNRIVSENELGFEIKDGKYFSVRHAKSKIYYINIISSQIKTWPSKAIKLKEDFDITNDEDLRKVYNLPHKITYETYLKSLQYKILNYIICTNSFLKQMKIINYEHCERCNSDTENLYHMLFSCRSIQRFWKELEILWKKYTDETIKIDLKLVFLGYFGHKNHRLLNYIILLSKSYIYKEKIQKRIPSVQGAIHYFQVKYSAGLIIAKRNEKEKSFNAMWKPLKRLFDK